MHEIKCPHCHTAFTVNEASYADILNQVRTQEFQTEIHERLQQAQMQFQSDMQLAQAQAQNQFDKILADKNHEIAALSNQINAYEKDSKLAAAEIEGRLKAQIAEQDKLIAELKAQAKSLETAKNMEKELEITKAVAEKERELGNLNTQLMLQSKENQLEKQSLREKYEAELKQKDETIAFYKDFKARQSTKMIGESLEQHCETEFNRIRTTAFPQAVFGKDNDAKTGSKGDYIYRETDEEGNEIISIMFEMKNENETTATKKKNEDFSLNQVIRVLDQIAIDVARLFNRPTSAKSRTMRTGARRSGAISLRSTRSISACVPFRISTRRMYRFRHRAKRKQTCS